MWMPSPHHVTSTRAHQTLCRSTGIYCFDSENNAMLDAALNSRRVAAQSGGARSPLSECTTSGALRPDVRSVALGERLLGAGHGVC